MLRRRQCLLAPPKVVCLTMIPGGGAMTTALQQLGYRPYTFLHAFTKGRVCTHPQEWCMVLDKKKPFNCAILAEDSVTGVGEGFDAIVGPPCTLAFETILKECPLSTRVILIEEEDKNMWERDVVDIWTPLIRQTERAARRQAGRHLHEMIKKMTLGVGDENRKRNVASLLETLEEHIKATVPKDRLLVYRHGDGWEPLCRFLGKPLPMGSSEGEILQFPARENGMDIVAHLCHRLQRAERVTTWAIWCLVAALIVLYTPLYVQLRDVVRAYYDEYCEAFAPVIRENEGKSISLRQAMVLAKNTTMSFEKKWRERGGVLGAAGEAMSKLGGGESDETGAA